MLRRTTMGKFHRATRFGWELVCQDLILKAYAQEHELDGGSDQEGPPEGCETGATKGAVAINPGDPRDPPRPPIP